MRHARTTKKIGRTASHRKATLQALSAALIRHKRITTTVSKAKALRQYVEPIITRAKEDSTHNRRQAFRRLQNKEAVKELFNAVSEAVGTRPGGYTRIIKLGKRAGDAAEMAMIELVDYNDVKPKGGSSSRSRTRRGSGKGRRRKKNKSRQQSEQSQKAEADSTPDEESASEDTQAEDTQKADAASSDAANPETTGNPQIPETPGTGEHPDAEQGATPGTGEPPPSSQTENQGRSGHRG